MTIVVEGLSETTGHALKPPGRVKFFYSLGQVVESGYLAINAFVFFYYTAVLGLSGSMVGVALAISLVLDAAADPLIGSWSDSVRSRFGRRLPLMLLGAPLTMITMGLLFAPPSGLSPLLMFLWLTLTKMGVRAFASMFNIPFFALGGEMSDDYLERTRIVAYRLLGGIAVTVGVTFIAFAFFFTGQAGLQRAEAYPAFGWTIASLVLFLALASCAGVWRFAAALPQPTTRPEPMGPRLVGELREIFANPSFRVLFVSLLVFTSAAGVNAALNNHAYVFAWKLPATTIQFLSYALLAGITAGIPITPPLLRVLEKKTVVFIGFLVVIAAWALLPALWWSGLFRPSGTEALPWLLFSTFLAGVGTGLIFIAFPSMMADAADEHELLFGHRREGLYFSGLGFAGKAAGGVGTMVGGFALDFIRFPQNAGQPGAVAPTDDVLAALVLAWGPLPAIISLVGAFIFMAYGITRARHADIAAKLRAKRALDVAEGRSS